MSNVNNNLFSGKEAESVGAAAHIDYKGAVIIKSDTVNKQTQSMTFNATYDFLQNSFTPIERFRNVEFDRDWNIVASIGFGKPGDPVFNAVHDIAVGRDGSIYVAETRTKRVVKLRPVKS